MTNAPIPNEINAEDRQALAFLKTISNKSKSTDFFFRSFDDAVLSDGKKRSDKTLAKNYDFGLKACITELRETNSKGAGVFVVINEGGQKGQEITRVRAVFADTDGAPLGPLLTLTPHMVVESSPNKWHVYWLVDADFKLEDFTPIQKAIAIKYGTDISINDLPRVMRLPGFFHNKSTPFPVRIIKLKKDLPRYSSAEIIDGLRLETVTHPSEPLFKVEHLGVSGTKTDESFPYEENKHDFYDALCAAYSNPETRVEWRAGVCALAYLTVVMGWSENETRLMRESWENLAKDADKTDNEAQWQDALARTEDRVKAGEAITTHLTVLKKARDIGWQPKTKVTDALAAVQNKFALISLGGKVGIIDKQELEAINIDGTATRLVVMSRNDGGLLVLRYLSSEYPQVDSKTTLNTFIHSKDTTLYNGVEFNPRSTTPNVLNLWVGITIKPRLGNWSLIYTLLHDVLCGGRESEYQYLVRYIAHALQRPWEKPGVMIILLGGQGIGKGTLAKLLQKIWSATFLQVNRIKQVVGDFNGSLERAYVVFLDEALFAGDRNSSDALKSLVTEPTISINEKHQPARQITSYHRFFSATNADHFKATDRDDRRDFVLRVSEHRKGDYAFWDLLNAEIENGGAAAFTHDLLAMDLTGFNVRAKPNTRELTEQKLQSLEKFPRWWFDCLSQGKIHTFNNEWPDFISSASLLRLFLEAEKTVRNYKQLIDRDVVAFMTKMCPSAKREQGMEGSHRKRGYIMPEVNIARNDFEKYIGDSVEWEIL
jgi:hypothetical protein